MISGIELIRVVEATVEEQVRDASANRDRSAEEVANQIAKAQGVFLSEKQRTELIRALRKKNPLNEVVLAEDLEWLDPLTVAPFRQEALRLLDRLSTETHQARTQAAYISTVLRPFNPKYSFHWLTGRTDIEPKDIEPKIAKLERAKISGTDQLLKWGDEVAELFRELVVIEEGSVDHKTFKPNGTVSSLSSRTYLQSWLAFIRKNSDSLLEPKGFSSSDVDLDQNVDVSTSNFRLMREFQDSSSRAEAPQYDADVSGSVVDWISYEGTFEEEPAIQFARSLGSELPVQQQAPRAEPAPAAPEKRLGLTIEAELTSGEKAKCHFEVLTEAKAGLKSWLTALDTIWEPGITTVQFQANLATADNQYSFSLPACPMDQASVRLELLLERVLELK